MGEDEETNVRKKKQTEQKKLAEAKQAEEQLKTALRMALENDAYERMMNVKLANQQLFLLAAQNIIPLFKRFERKINDQEVLLLLRKIKEQTERKSEITFQRK